MLKLNPDPQFKADFEITIPGQTEPGSISLTCKYRNKKEMSEFWKSKKDDLSLMLDIVVGWNGIDAEFNKKNVEIFLNNYPASASEIAVGYSSLLVVSRRKN